MIKLVILFYMKVLCTVKINFFKSWSYFLHVINLNNKKKIFINCKLFLSISNSDLIKKKWEILDSNPDITTYSDNASTDIGLIGLRNVFVITNNEEVNKNKSKLRIWYTNIIQMYIQLDRNIFKSNVNIII